MVGQGLGAVLERGGEWLEAGDGADVVLVGARREDDVRDRLEGRVEHGQRHVVLVRVRLDRAQDGEEDLLRAHLVARVVRLSAASRQRMRRDVALTSVL